MRNRRKPEDLSNDFKVWLCLREKVQEKEEGIKTSELVEELGISERTVQRSLNYLVEDGWRGKPLAEKRGSGPAIRYLPFDPVIEKPVEWELREKARNTVEDLKRRGYRVVTLDQVSDKSFISLDVESAEEKTYEQIVREEVEKAELEIGDEPIRPPKPF